MPEIIKNYHQDAALRQSFNALAQETFGLSFENWYQNGFWGDHYTPYSILENGRIIANVSLNRTDMTVLGTRRRLYQLGTVMTDKAHRGRGLIRAIMAEIEKDTADADGVYLFANDSVLDFYPKFGFTRGSEYIYAKTVCPQGPCRFAPIKMDNPAAWARLRAAMDSSVFPAACRMEDNPELIFFYVSQFMQENVYWDEATGTWAIAEIQNGHLLLHNVFAPQSIPLDTVVSWFGHQVASVTLGFTPADPAGFTCQQLHEEDCTFFVKGDLFNDFKAHRLRIPSLSHA